MLEEGSGEVFAAATVGGASALGSTLVFSGGIDGTDWLVGRCTAGSTLGIGAEFTVRSTGCVKTAGAGAAAELMVAAVGTAAAGRIVSVPGALGSILGAASAVGYVLCGARPIGITVE